MHFKRRLTAPLQKVLLFSPLSSYLRSRLPWQHQKTSHRCGGAPGHYSSCCSAGERPGPCCPLPALGAAASLLGCPQTGQAEEDQQRAQL